MKNLLKLLTYFVQRVKYALQVSAERNWSKRLVWLYVQNLYTHV